MTQKQLSGVVPTDVYINEEALTKGLERIHPVEAGTIVRNTMVVGQYADNSGDFQVVVALEHIQTGEMVFVPYRMAEELLNEIQDVGAGEV